MHLKKNNSSHVKGFKTSVLRLLTVQSIPLVIISNIFQAAQSLDLSLSSFLISKMEIPC